MAFVLTLLYLAIALLSPAIFPEEVLSLHVVEILAFLMLLAGFTSIARSGLLSTPFSYLVGGVVFFSAVSTLATGWFGGVPATLAFILPPVYTFYFLVITCRTLPRIRIVAFVMTAVCLSIFLHGFFAELMGDLSSPYILMEHTLVRYRGLGFLSDPNDTAQVYASTIPLLWLHWRRGRTFGNTWKTLIPAALLIFAIYKTHSRGGLIALIALLLFALKDKVGLIVSTVAAGAFTVAVLALNLAGGRGMNEDDGGRVGLWGTGLHVFLTHPFFGVGTNNFGDYTDNGLTAHNSYVLGMAELGIFGYFCWIGLLVFSWSALSSIVRRASADGSTAEDELPPGTPADGYPASPFAMPTPAFATPAFAPAAPVPEKSPTPEPVVSTLQARGPDPQPWLTAARSFGNNSLPSQPGMLPSEPGVLPGQPGVLGLLEPDAPGISDDVFRRAATMLRLSFVGFMVTAFFLSRTYTMVLFILLGLSTALQLVYARQHPDFQLDLKQLFTRTALFVVGSIVFIWLFIRIKGV